MSKLTRRSFLQTLGGVVVIGGLSACGGNSNGGSTSGDVITIKLAGTVSEDHPITKAEHKFAELIAEKSGGTMKRSGGPRKDREKVRSDP